MLDYLRIYKGLFPLFLVFCYSSAFSISIAKLKTTAPTYCPSVYTGTKTITCVDAGTGRFDPQTCSTCINNTKWCCVSSNPTPQVQPAYCVMGFTCSSDDNKHYIGINYDANVSSQGTICSYSTLKSNGNYQKFSSCQPNSLRSSKDVWVHAQGDGYTCPTQSPNVLCKK